MTELLSDRGAAEGKNKNGAVDNPELDHETANSFVVTELKDPYSTTME